MNIRLNKLLLCIIIALICIFYLVQNIITMEYGTLFTLCLSSAFLLLYKTKKKRWSLVLGLYLLFMGLGSFFSQSFFSVVLDFFGAMFFLVPGAIFFILYREKKKKPFLIISVILILVGFKILI